MSSTRSSRCVRVNKRYRESQDEDDESKLPKRRCERNGCPCDVPICFARVADRCAGSKWTSRWYHITPAEHFCNECFEYFYRCHKHGHQLFEDWKRDWASHGRSEASLKKFMCDTLVPYWVQCTISGCRKWRQLSKDVILKPTFIDKYVCGMSASGMKKGNQKDACSNPEDERVACVEEKVWLRQATVPPYLKNSPAVLMLLGYYPDGVGISATDPVMHTEKSKPTVFPCCEYVSPFVLSEGKKLAYMVMPDMMGKDEIAAFPLVAEYQPYLYLAIRNLILAVWSQNIKEWVTREHCARQVICRGLNRACCIYMLDPVLAFLTSEGYINVGLVSPPPYLTINTGSQCDVIILGAGASGVAAARRLSDFGLKVKVLESKNRSGGRIWDESRGGVCFAQGAQLMAGAVNNPMAILAYQSGEPVHKVIDRCQLLLDKGKLVDPVMDRRLDFHFNALLDVLGQWRQRGQPDVSLSDKYKELHQEFEEETQLKFTEEEQQILQFHLSSLEYVGGCSLQKLSALHWDQNEALPQFGDPHLLLPSGYGALLQRIAQGLDIVYQAKVTEVNYSGDKTIVKTTSGDTYTADKVLVTLPLAVLQSDCVRFEPQLPDDKVKAIASLGAGRVEKVIFQFNENFWKKKTKGDDFFGHVPSSEATRGLFNLFYTVTCRPCEASRKETHLLVTHIVGQALDLVQGKTESEIKKMCLKTLRTIFPGKVPDPVSWCVTSWHRDTDIGMTHTYLPVGVNGDAMDVLADDVADRIYFAGEATCRQFPQSVAGAYISGIRESAKIIDDITTSLDQGSDSGSLEASVVENKDASISENKEVTAGDESRDACESKVVATAREGKAVDTGETVDVAKNESKGDLSENKDSAIGEKKDVATSQNKDVVTGENKDVIMSENKDVIMSENKDVATGENKDVIMSENKDVAMSENKDVFMSENKDVAMSENKDVIMSENKDVATGENKDVIMSENKDVAMSENKDVIMSENKDVATGENKDVIMSENKDVAMSENKDVIMSENKDVATGENKDVIMSENKDAATSETKDFANSEKKDVTSSESKAVATNHIKDFATSENKSVSTSEAKDVAACKKKDVTIGEKKDVTIGEKKGVTIGEKKDVTIGEKKDVTIGEKKDVTIGEKKDVTIGEKKDVTIGEEKDVATSVNACENKDVNTSEKKDVTIGEKKDGTIGENKDVTIGENKDVTMSENKDVTIGENKDVTIGERKDVIMSENKDVTIGEEKDVATSENKDVTTSENKDVASENTDFAPDENKEGVFREDKLAVADEEMAAAVSVMDNSATEDKHVANNKIADAAFDESMDTAKSENISVTDEEMAAAVSITDNNATEDKHAADNKIADAAFDESMDTAKSENISATDEEMAAAVSVRDDNATEDKHVVKHVVNNKIADAAVDESMDTAKSENISVAVDQKLDAAASESAGIASGRNMDVTASNCMDVSASINNS